MRLRDPQQRFDPPALLCTDPGCDPLQIVRWFVQRWQVEATSREVRDHLGVETQRPYRPAVAGRFPAGPDRQLGCRWSDLAIARTTPCLLGLFSVVTRLAARLGPQARLAVATAAWYRKTRPTFADTLAAARRHTWADHGFRTSRHAAEATKPPPDPREGIAHARRHAASARSNGQSRAEAVAKRASTLRCYSGCRRSDGEPDEPELPLRVLVQRQHD